jgi:RimJ/RimL family protein N-acetyltransferase
MPPVTELETARLVLRRLCDDDAPFIVGLLNEPSFLRYIGDKGVRSEEDARRYLRDGPLASYGRHGFGLYLVELKESGQPIGISGLLKRDYLEDPDVGFAFLPRFWSQGYGLESAAAVLAQGRERFGLRRVLAITSPDNLASIALLGKLGFRFERTARPSEDEAPVNVYVCEP